MNWFLLAMKNTFNFEGRARRREFGWFMLISALISFSLQVLSLFAVQLNLDLLEKGLVVAYTLFSLTMIIPSLSVQVRRLHDLGYSGWWILGLYALLFFGAFLFVFSEEGRHIVMFACIFIGISFIFSLFLYFKDGQKFPNRYGESPKYPSQTAENGEKNTVLLS